MTICCLVCHGPLGSPYVAGMPDFPGDTAYSPGQTLTLLAPPYGKGTLMRCHRCGIDYRIQRAEPPRES